MLNQNINKELLRDDKIHRLFNHQKAADLSELSEILKYNDENILVLEFSNKELDEIIATILQDNDEESKKRSTKYVALKLLKELSKKDNSVSNLHIDELLESFKRESTYLENQDKYPSIEDVIELINLNKSIKRIHIIMNNIRSAIICEGTVPLIGDNLNFATSIYNSPNKFYPSVIRLDEKIEYLSNLYSYIEYDENNTGILSKKIIKDNKQCQNTKKYT